MYAQDSCACTTLLCMHDTLVQGLGPAQRPKPESIPCSSGCTTCNRNVWFRCSSTPATPPTSRRRSRSRSPPPICNRDPLDIVFHKFLHDVNVVAAKMQPLLQREGIMMIDRYCSADFLDFFSRQVILQKTPCILYVGINPSKDARWPWDELTPSGAVMHEFLKGLRRVLHGSRFPMCFGMLLHHCPL